MEKTPDKTQAPVEHKPGVFRTMVGYATYPVSLVAGYFGAANRIRHTAYKTLKEADAFKDIGIEFDTKQRETVAQCLRGEITPEANVAALVENKLAHSQEVGRRLEEIGFDSIKKKWSIINRGNKQDAVLAGIKILGISLGALSIANSDMFQNLLNKNEGKGREL